MCEHEDSACRRRISEPVGGACACHYLCDLSLIVVRNNIKTYIIEKSGQSLKWLLSEIVSNTAH
jgi:hypothetical protein